MIHNQGLLKIGSRVLIHTVSVQIPYNLHAYRHESPTPVFFNHIICFCLHSVLPTFYCFVHACYCLLTVLCHSLLCLMHIKYGEQT